MPVSCSLCRLLPWEQAPPGTKVTFVPRTTDSVGVFTVPDAWGSVPILGGGAAAADPSVAEGDVASIPPVAPESIIEHLGRRGRPRSPHIERSVQRVQERILRRNPAVVGGRVASEPPRRM